VRAGDIGLAALIGEEGGADLGNGGEVGDVGGDLGSADFGFGDDAAADFHAGGAAVDLRAEDEGRQGGLDGVGLVGAKVAPEEFGGDGAVVRAGVDVEEIEPLAEGAGGGGFAGGGAAVDGDNEEGGHGENDQWRMTNDQ